MTGKQKVDYLESDEPIPEQRYACLSLVLPESMVQKRELFYMTEFFKKVCQKYELPKEKLAEITEDFEQFKQLNGQEIDRQFAKANKNRTSINGLKLRGIYETKEEAENRSDKLRAKDPDFNVFIADVGRWLPISPSIEYHVKNEKFLDTQLNDLIGGYKKNLRQKDEFYEQQKREKMTGTSTETKQALPAEMKQTLPSGNIKVASYDTVLDSLAADHTANRESFNKDQQALQAADVQSPATGASSSAAPSASTAPAASV